MQVAQCNTCNLCNAGAITPEQDKTGDDNMCQNGTARITPETARKIFQEQNWSCHYCKTVMIDCQNMPAKNSPAMEQLARGLGIEPFTSRWTGRIKQHCATVDHIHPQVKGGNDDSRNLVGACGYCNSFKSDTDYETAKQKIKALVSAGKHPCHL